MNCYRSVDIVTLSVMISPVYVPTGRNKFPVSKYFPFRHFWFHFLDVIKYA